MYSPDNLQSKSAQEKYILQESHPIQVWIFSLTCWMDCLLSGGIMTVATTKSYTGRNGSPQTFINIDSQCLLLSQFLVFILQVESFPQNSQHLSFYCTWNFHRKYHWPNMKQSKVKQNKLKSSIIGLNPHHLSSAHSAMHLVYIF